MALGGYLLGAVVLSAMVVPDPSSMLQRPIRPAADVIGPVIPAWIALALRATFQMRGSSRMPWNPPLAVPVDVKAAASPAC